MTRTSSNIGKDGEGMNKFKKLKADDAISPFSVNRKNGDADIKGKKKIFASSSDDVSDSEFSDDYSGSHYLQSEDDFKDWMIIIFTQPEDLPPLDNILFNMPVVVPPKVTTRNSLKLSFQVTGNSKVEGAPAKLPIPYTGRKKINYESFPFDVPFWEDYNPIVSDFEDWLQIGLYIKPKKSESGTLFYYKKSSRILRQEFDFNVTTIDQKDWFLKLA
ncbi:ADP-ribosylation factor 1, partial [Striga asiatica]